MQETRIITFGTFDLFHIGHVNILGSCKEMFQNSYVIVGVSSDTLNIHKKNRTPFISCDDRIAIIKSLKYVDEVFIEHSLTDKLQYCQKTCADIIIMGDDHSGKFDFLQKYGIKVIYIPRTEDISTTDIIEKIKNYN